MNIDPVCNKGIASSQQSLCKMCDRAEVDVRADDVVGAMSRSRRQHPRGEHVAPRDARVASGSGYMQAIQFGGEIHLAEQPNLVAERSQSSCQRTAERSNATAESREGGCPDVDFQ
jgi:hypothetical protein